MPCRINNANGQRPLSEKTIAVTARHRGGELEYDVHNLYSLYQVTATHDTLEGLAPKRPFILTRSTWLGSGSKAAHWTGDTASTWCAPAQVLSCVHLSVRGLLLRPPLHHCSPAHRHPLLPSCSWLKRFHRFSASSASLCQANGGVVHKYVVTLKTAKSEALHCSKRRQEFVCHYWVPLGCLWQDDIAL